MNIESKVLQTPSKATRLADGVAVHQGVRPAGEGCGRHTHDFHSITVLLSTPGRSVWTYGNEKSRSVRPVAGDVFFCPAHVPTVVHCEKAYESILLCLSPTTFSRAANASGGVDLGDAAPAIMLKDSFIERVVSRLADEVGLQRKDGGELFASSLATALGVHLSRHTNEMQSTDAEARLSDEELAQLNKYIDRNLAMPLTLEDLSSLVGRSRFHFSRLFKTSTGVTPHQYVIYRRVERAAELLRAGGAIIEVAATVGFASQSHLHFHIRRVFGCTPGQLVRRSRNN